MLNNYKVFKSKQTGGKNNNLEGFYSCLFSLLPKWELWPKVTSPNSLPFPREDSMYCMWMEFSKFIAFLLKCNLLWCPGGSPLLFLPFVVQGHMVFWSKNRWFTIESVEFVVTAPLLSFEEYTRNVRRILFLHCKLSFQQMRMIIFFTFIGMKICSWYF